jgi:hypothetical protein
LISQNNFKPKKLPEEFKLKIVLQKNDFEKQTKIFEKKRTEAGVTFRMI